METTPLDLFVHLRGQLLRTSEARISPFDRGFQLGDGVFETLRAYDGRPFGLEGHLARLKRSCDITRLPFPAGLVDAIGETLEANDLSEAVVRITITRGPGGRGASPRGAGPSTVLVTTMPIPYDEAFYARGVRAIVSKRRRMGAAALDPGVKTINYLVNVLARAEAEDEGADDALFVDADGFVVEATQANVFARLGDRIVTPPLSSGCLPGHTRGLVIALAKKEGLDVEEAPLRVSELKKADEVFLTASILEVAALISLDGSPIGNGHPGETSRILRSRYHAYAREHS